MLAQAGARGRALAWLRVTPGGPCHPLWRASVSRDAPSTGRSSCSQSPCPPPSPPSPACSTPRPSSGSLAAAPLRRAASGPWAGRSASSPPAPLSSPAVCPALTRWLARSRRRRSCSRRPASVGGGAASRGGPSPSCGVSPGQGLWRCGCRLRAGRALRAWCPQRPRRPASRGSALARGRRWRSRSVWACAPCCGFRSASRRPRAGAWGSCVLGGQAPGGARQGWRETHVAPWARRVLCDRGGGGDAPSTHPRDHDTDSER